MENFRIPHFAVVCSALILAACSDGGGAPPAASAPTPTPPPSGGSGPTWTAGVYEPASRFKNRCEAPRSGVDIEGNPFPDIAGSLLEELFWLRSWTNETYLWNTEVPDQNPASFSDRLAYFDVLVTTQLTPSGQPKDQFHFSQPTMEYLEQRNSVPSASYGASLIAFSTTVPRDIRVQFTQAGTPAAELVMGQANLVRGTRILEVDGIDLVNANTQADVDALNAGLFPENAGELHTFLVEDPGGVPRTIMMMSADIATAPVNRTSIINTATGDVGYILITTFSPFSSEQAIANAITAMKAQGVVDVILDLRHNGGGLLAIAAQLGYMIAGDAQTNGKVFEDLRFNAAAGGVNPVTGETDNALPFFNTGLGFTLANGTPLDSLDLSRVFILTTDETCSASESIINSLRGADVDVILIGGTTCGKPFGFYPTDNCGETYYTIQFQGVNDKGFGDYADGFIAANSNATIGVRIPGCAVADDYANELGDTSEALLAAALQYRDAGTCPTPPPVTTAPKTLAAKPSSGIDMEVIPPRSIMQANRDMTMPERLN